MMTTFITGPTDILLWLCLVFSVCATVLLIVVLVKISAKNGEDPARTIRDELRLGRDESTRAARELREEVTAGQKAAIDIMFLPTEGLYAEVLRQPGQLETIMQTYRVVVAGPTTLSAILSSLRMGFRTLAIEKRSSEVWKVLGAVKTEFGKFREILAKVKRQLATASNTIDQTGVRTRAMAKRLQEVEQLPSDVSADLLELPEVEEDEADSTDIRGLQSNGDRGENL